MPAIGITLQHSGDFTTHADDNNVSKSRQLYAQLLTETAMSSEFQRRKDVSTNGSAIACYADPIHIQSGSIQYPIHANEIHFSSEQLLNTQASTALPTLTVHCAAQTPDQDQTQHATHLFDGHTGDKGRYTTELMLEQAITSGQGLFQYVSPRAHRYFLNARDNLPNHGPATRDHSLLLSLLERTKQGRQTDPIILGRYE
jgi:hypothetical protein